MEWSGVEWSGVGFLGGVECWMQSTRILNWSGGTEDASRVISMGWTRRQALATIGTLIGRNTRQVGVAIVPGCHQL